MLRKFISRLIGMPRGSKKIIIVSFDIVALCTALWLSFALRLDRWTLPMRVEEVAIILAAPAVAIPIFIREGLYRAVIRYLPEKALWTILRAVTIAVLMWVVVVFLAQAFLGVLIPRSVPVIYWAVASMIIIGSRFATKRLLWPSASHRLLKRPAVVIYGAGASGTQLAMSLRTTHFVAGFLDDKTSLHGREVAGHRVYPPAALSRLVEDYGVKQVLLTMPSISQARRKEIVSYLAGKGVTVRFLPAADQLVEGDYLVSQIKEIQIDDLLGRSSVPPDLDLIEEMVAGRTIMVTGAGGSIGSELCRKIANWGPKLIVLYEANEFALYQIERELTALKEGQCVPVLASVTDEQRVRHTISTYAVDAVFHAAAHKHVPLVEANALEGIRNNVFGTHTVAKLAFSLGVKDFLLISTDKAVRPTNVMGATKRWAELIVQQMADRARSGDTGQRFCAVRFGNVLGSNGSVVPLFKEQIARGGPITLTDVKMTRYFMSIHEAAELIVQAGALSQNGDVFLLDMGEPILIAELAENMVRLAGLMLRSEEHPDGDIAIVETGKRPGEKMYEELFYDQRTAETTRHKKILRTMNTTIDNLDVALATLQRALQDCDDKMAREFLFAVVAQSDTSRSPADAQAS